MKLKIVLCILILTSIEVSAEKSKILEHKLISDEFSERKTMKYQPNQPLIGVEILLNKIYKSKDKILIEVKDYNPEADQGPQKILSLESDEFVYIKGADNIKRLFNGSIIIKFNQLPNFNNFAIANEMSFVADLSDISRGIFKINNLYELEEKIKNLKLDNNILAIELDTIDLSTEPN